MDEITLLARFKNKNATAEEYLFFSKKILSTFKAHFKEFKTIYAWGKTAESGRYLKDDLSDFEKVVFKQIHNHCYSYINENISNQDFNLQSKSHIGYSNTYSSNKEHINSLEINIAYGDISEKSSGIINCGFSDDLQEKVSLNFIILIIKSLIEIIDLEYAYTYGFSFEQQISSQSLEKNIQINSDDIQIGWINYISKPEIFHLLPNSVGKVLMPNKGVIFWLSEEKTESLNDDVIQLALEIESIIQEKGLR